MHFLYAADIKIDSGYFSQRKVSDKNEYFSTFFDMFATIWGNAEQEPAKSFFSSSPGSAFLWIQERAALNDYLPEAVVAF